VSSAFQLGRYDAAQDAYLRDSGLLQFSKERGNALARLGAVFYALFSRPLCGTGHANAAEMSASREMVAAFLRDRLQCDEDFIKIIEAEVKDKSDLEGTLARGSIALANRLTDRHWDSIREGGLAA